MTYDELIVKLEAATEGSGELDVAIEMAVGEAPSDAYFQDYAPDDGSSTWRTPRADMEYRFLHERGVPKGREARKERRRECGTEGDAGLGWAARYTRSLDAALTLVPEGWGWMAENPTPWGKAQFRILQHVGDGTIAHSTGEHDTKNPALALCIASFKARTAMENE